MRVELWFNRGKLLFSNAGGSPEHFYNHCHAVISKVGKNTRKGTEESCRQIMEESVRQVPRSTGSLASTAAYMVTGNYKRGWDGEMAYGSRTGVGMAVNVNSGKPVDWYMTTVDEDLSVKHVVGKAKFLEDPIREYARARFPRTVLQYWDIENTWNTSQRETEKTVRGATDTWLAVFDASVMQAKATGMRNVMRGTSKASEPSTNSTYKTRSPNSFGPRIDLVKRYKRGKQ